MKRAYRLLRTAKWRKAPATESQKQFLTKRYFKVNSGGGDEHKLEKIAKLTKGDASNIIVRLKHGAQVSQALLILAD